MSDENHVDLKKGISFSFQDDGDQINFKSSPYSGLEEVYVNGKLITSQKNYSKKSSADFELDGNAYTIELEVVSMMKGPINCTLKKGDSAIKKKQIVFIKPDNDSSSITGNPKKYIFAAIAGMLFAFIKIYLELPFESFYYFIGAVILFFLVFEYTNQEDPKFLMKEVAID